MSSVKRSRSPRYKREDSFSSLSSGSFDNSHTSSYSRKPNNKSGRDRNSNNRRNDRSSRRYSKERRGDSKVHRYERVTGQTKEKEKEHNKHSNDIHYRSPEEESYLKLTSHKDLDMRTFISEKVGQDDTEESMRDPSTCNFRGALHITEDEVILPIIHEETVKILEERKNPKDENSDRIERLEKLVELLVNNKKTQSQTNLTNTSDESNWQSNTGILELNPRNTNFTTSMWLNKIQEECNDKNFDEKTSIQFMQSKMTGVVKTWFKTISSFDVTWPELKMLITEIFPDNIDFASTLRLLVERNKKPDEAVTQYYYSKMYLLEACKISGANAVSCLIDGLDNELWKQEAKSHNHLIPEALYSHCLSKYIDYDYGQYQQNSEDLVEVYTSQVYTEDFTNDNTENQGHSQFISNKKFTKKQCWTCKKFGHITADCRHAPICYRCKNKGHIAANCPLKKTNV